MEETYLELSIQLLWSVMLLLVALTLLLFAASAIARYRHWKYDLKVEDLKEKLYPLIFSYLNEETTKEDIDHQFSGRGLEYSVFEDIIFEMLDNLEGDEARSLRELLFMEPIFKHHLDELNSSSDVVRIKACNYFANLRLINYKVINRLIDFLKSDNKLLVFSAASALMASRQTDIRALALHTIVKKKHYSGMAMLEMVYKFHSLEDEQMDEEVEVLRGLIDNDEIPAKNAAILIQAASEFGYHELMPYLHEKLQSDKNRWQKPEVLKALIQAQGKYYNMDASEDIKQYITHEDPQVRRMVAFALGQFGSEEELKILYEMLQDPEYKVKHMAARMLHENGDEGMKYLDKSFGDPDLNTELIVKTLTQ